MNWQHLPVEIQIIIFQHLKYIPVQLNQCQLTCKGWFSTAQRLIYSNVSIKRSKLEIFAQSISNESALHGNYVNTIHFCKFGKEKRNDPGAAYLLKIAECCPNVERILMNPEEASLFRKTLNHIGIAGNWDRIKELPQDYIEVPDHDPTFTQIVPHFTKSFEIIDFSMKISDTKLQIIYATFNALRRCLFSWINGIYIYSYVLDSFFDQIPATAKNLKIDAMTDNDYGVEEDKNIFAMLPMEKNNHLKSLQATLSILNSNTIEYALCKFSNLSSLTLIRSGDHSGNAGLFDIPRTLLNRIMELNTLELKNLNPTPYSLIFDILMREKNAIKELTLNRYSDSPQRNDVKFILNIKKYIKCGSNIIGIWAKSNQSRHQINRELSSIETFYEMELLEEYGEFLDTLIICNLTTGKRWNESCLVSSLVHKCPRLKTLVFAGDDLVGIDRKMKSKQSKKEMPCIQNRSVKTLVLNQEHISSISNHLSQQFPCLSKVIMIVKKKAPAPSRLLLGAHDMYRNNYGQRDVWIELPHS